MARQVGVIKIEGGLGELSFYKSVFGNIVRRKGGPSRETIRKKRSCQGIRDSNKEFANAAAAAKLLRNGLAPLLHKIKDYTLVNRVTSMMMKIKNEDLISARGERSVAGGIITNPGKALLNGFEFNEKSSLSAVLKIKPTVNIQNYTVQVNHLVPARDLNAPTGATYVKLSAALLKIDFANAQKELQQSNSVLLPLNNSSNTVALQMASPAQTNGVEMYVLQIEFFQEVNAAYYNLENGRFNACGMVGVV